MKLAYLKAIALITTFLFTGCGGGGSSSSSEPIENPMSMTIGKRVVVKDGDTVTPFSSDTIIDVTHQVSNNVRSVTLVSGKASLLMGELTLVSLSN